MLIGLSGHKGAGKDTVAQILVEKYNFERRAFADKIKESASAIFAVPDPSLWDEYKNDDLNSSVTLEFGNGKFVCHMLIRQFLQRYGTEAHRDIFGEDFWIDMTLKDIYPKTKNYVIADCRFPNELKAIKQLGGQIVKVIGEEAEEDLHPSEAKVDHSFIDYYLYNKERSLKELQKSVEWMMVFLKMELPL